MRGMANFSTDSGELKVCVGVQYIMSSSSMNSLKIALGVSGVSSHVLSSSTNDGKQGKEDSDASSSSILPAGRQVCFLVGTGGGIVAV